MFMKSKIMWHLTEFEAAANTSSSCRKEIAKIVAETGLMHGAVHFAKQLGHPELGAFYILLEVGERVLENKSPPAFMRELAELLLEVLEVIQAKHGVNKVVADALSIQMRLALAAEADQL